MAEHRSRNPNSTTPPSAFQVHLQLIPPRDNMANHEEDHHYHPQDAVSAAVKTTMMTGGIGLFASAVQNTLVRQNVGPLGIFMRSGSTITILGMKAKSPRLLGTPVLIQTIF